MNDNRTIPTPPAGLEARGLAFWGRVHADYDLGMDEVELLVESCRALDECEGLAAAVAADGVTVSGSRGQVRAHPALSELRGTRQLLQRLLAQLQLPLPEEAGGGPSLLSPLQARGRNAARSRWTNEDTEAERGRRGPA